MHERPTSTQGGISEVLPTSCAGEKEGLFAVPSEHHALQEQQVPHSTYQARLICFTDKSKAAGAAQVMGSDT